MKACSFFGHRDTPQTEELKQKVRETVERLIVEEGVDTFLFGSRSKFDELCHMVVTELKEKYPHINYNVVLAYMPAEKEAWNPYEFGETMLPEGIESVHPRYAISWRNKWMVNESDVVVAYITHSWGGAAKYVETASKRNKEIINIAKLEATP